MVEESIFLTVGTTDFDLLINEINTERFLNYLLLNHYQRLTIQYGRGKVIPIFIQEKCLENKIECVIYRFKDSLEIDMKNSSFIICHAGLLHLSILHCILINH